VRICTWNVQLGRRLPQVLDAVSSLPDFRRLDLLALQEASVHNERPDAEAIAEAMGPGYSYFQATAQRIRDRDQSNALIWRRRFFRRHSPEVVSLSDIEVPQLTRVERTLLRVMPPQRRIAIRAESASLRVYVVHLDVMGFAHKLEQFRAVLQDIAARPAVRRTVLAGDLNTIGPPRLHAWGRIREAAHEAGLVEVTRGVRRTHWTGQKLDAIYASDTRGRTHRAWTRAVKASDHLPVFAEL
jgi:endonuclease/exonuclease/phosphatase family metal-dependent hydrolase